MSTHLKLKMYKTNQSEILIQYERESELLLIIDLIAYSLLSFDPRFQHLGRVVISTTKKYDKIKHSPGAAAPAGISPFTSLSCVSSPSEEGVREATSCIPGSRIFKET